jgi:hypothetical protein
MQALIAVSEVVQQLNNKNPNFVPVNKNEPTKIVLLSIGTGRNGETKGYDALKARFFTGYEWIPLIAQSLGTSMGDMNEYHLKSVFPDLPTSDNYYLRIDVTSYSLLILFFYWFVSCLVLYIYIYLSFKKNLQIEVYIYAGI